MVGAWTMEHFLIATTMLAVGLFAVLSWESTFPDPPRRSGARPSARPRAHDVSGESRCRSQRARSHSGALHALAGIAWPLALACRSL